MPEVVIVSEKRAIVHNDCVHCSDLCYHFVAHPRQHCAIDGSCLYNDGEFPLRSQYCIDHARPYIMQGEEQPDPEVVFCDLLHLSKHGVWRDHAFPGWVSQLVKRDDDEEDLSVLDALRVGWPYVAHCFARRLGLKDD